MLLLWVTPLVFAGLCVAVTEDFPIRDPNVYPPPSTTRPCGQFPHPTKVNLIWSGEVIDSVTWEMIRKGLLHKNGSTLKQYRTKVVNTTSQPVCRSKLYSTEFIKFYWDVACPYDIVQLTGFYWATKQRWCYIPFSCLQRVEMVVARRKYCCIDPRFKNPDLNSVCLLNRFMTKKVFAYCPKVSRRYRSLRAAPPAVRKPKPWKYFEFIDLDLPQCCECWTCQDMRITKYMMSVNSPRFTEA